MDQKLKDAIDMLADQKGEALNQAALTLLLRVIEVNGGRIHRGALATALGTLHYQGLITESFTPPTAKNHTNYDFLLTDDGRKHLEGVKAEQIKKLEVKEIKHKKDRVTVLEYKGERYALERPGPAVNAHKQKVKKQQTKRDPNKWLAAPDINF